MADDVKHNDAKQEANKPTLLESAIKLMNNPDDKTFVGKVVNERLRAFLEINSGQLKAEVNALSAVTGGALAAPVNNATLPSKPKDGAIRH